ncbi:MAG: tRNA pseudouridine(55) synthase TruB [Firmicutes bacterium HGW-Firmicutes-11]|jgi:tRNA pseudouridine55 synthase|nr:MAG: tRNA pseudouridine(55) synthase TruB [Firmicutes bacterium HGW-Firmicutes-11]
MKETTGIINLLKPPGMTSHDCISFLRRTTGIKRIGHTGTLDPMAVGVLPICIGTATRIIDYLDGGEKSYRCEMLLGVETDTQDIWGTVLSDHREVTIDEDSLINAMNSLTGEILQTPPSYSALKVDGRRAYDYARKGIEVTLEPRPASIRSLKLIRYDKATNRVLFDVVCGRGTYVRTLCFDIGRRLGCGATMSFLIRTASGPFRLNEAVTPEALLEDWQQSLLPVDFPLGHLGKIQIPGTRVGWYSNGGYLRKGEVQIIKTPDASRTEERMKKSRGQTDGYTVYSDGVFLGTSRYDEVKELFFADKVLCR